MGYFKAKRQFFAFEPQGVAGDVRYLLARYFPGKTEASVRSLPSRPTRALIRQTVLALLGYSPWDASALQLLEDRARRMAMRSTQPLYLLREILQCIEQERFEVPRYSTLQDLVGRVAPLDRYSRHESGQFLDLAGLRIRFRAALPRSAQEDADTGCLRPPEPLRRGLDPPLAQGLRRPDEAAIEILRGTSPVAWQHVNLFGSIKFNDLGDLVDIDALAARYADPEFWSQALQELQAGPLA
ncbi:DUF4158 domain-containing protein [Pseudomonas nicosulfuronedens]